MGYNASFHLLKQPFPPGELISIPLRSVIIVGDHQLTALTEIITFLGNVEIGTEKKHFDNHKKLIILSI